MAADSSDDWTAERSSAAEQVASTPLARSPLATVAQQLRDVSPSWARAAVAEGAEGDGLATPFGLSRDRVIGVEAIREGWLLHRGASRLAPSASPDLALLVGDWCYASGLCSIADHGSLDDVARLAELVADVSVRRAEAIEELEPCWTDTIGALSRG